MLREAKLAQAFIEVSDTLVDDFGVTDLLTLVADPTVSERSSLVTAIPRHNDDAVSHGQLSNFSRPLSHLSHVTFVRGDTERDPVRFRTGSFRVALGFGHPPPRAKGSPR